VLIAALSGRAPAAAALRAGYAPLVADLFGDEDMRVAVCGSERTRGDLEAGLDEESLLETLARMAEGQHCIGVVCGSGFEDRPGLLERIAARWPLLGNDAATVRRAKDPFGLAALCGELGVPHPEVAETRPADSRGWLRKRIGGSGGTHVQPADRCRSQAEEVYYQRRVAGRAVSALFLANGEEALLVGLSAQWSNPKHDAGARYGGAVRPAGIGRPLARRLRRHLAPLSRALGLRGLNSADFLVGRGEYWLLEINPRPGATLDLFDCPAAPLFALHLDACRGALPARAPRQRGAAAVAIAYATREIAHMPRLDWPVWCADRQTAGSRLREGDPICSVAAKALSSETARGLVETRIRTVLGLAQGRVN